MKTWFLTLALLGATGFAQADGMPEAAAAKAAAAQTQAEKKAPKRPFRPQPPGDLRQCLELGSNEAIIRCVEKPSRK